MLEGEAVLVEDDGETILAAGDCAAWPKGSHQRPSFDQRERAPTAPSSSIGGGTNTGGGYSDIDMLFTADGRYVHKDGTPYVEAAGLGGLRLILLDHPRLVLGLVDPFGDVRVRQHRLHIDARRRAGPGRRR